MRLNGLVALEVRSWRTASAAHCSKANLSASVSGNPSATNSTLGTWAMTAGSGPGPATSVALRTAAGWALQASSTRTCPVAADPPSSAESVAVTCTAGPPVAPGADSSPVAATATLPGMALAQAKPGCWVMSPTVLSSNWASTDRRCPSAPLWMLSGVGVHHARVTEVWSPVPRVSNRASLMVSLVISGNPRWRARGTARVVLPLVGAPVTSTRVGNCPPSGCWVSLSAWPDHGGAGGRGGTSGEQRQHLTDLGTLATPRRQDGDLPRWRDCGRGLPPGVEGKIPAGDPGQRHRQPVTVTSTDNR